MVSVHKSEKALIAVSGTCLTGKTTLARGMSEKLGIVHIDIDEVRARIYAPDKVGVILPEEQERRVMLNCYVEMYRLAREILERGDSVIVNATHSRGLYHDIARTTAQYTSAQLIAVLLDINKVENPREFLAERLRIRDDRHDSASNVTGDCALEYAIGVFGRFSPFREEEVSKLIRTDPSLPAAEQNDYVLGELRKCLGVIRRKELASRSLA